MSDPVDSWRVGTVDGQKRAMAVTFGGPIRAAIRSVGHEFAKHQILNENKMVLDFSALLLLYQISMFHKYQFPAKFVLSKYIVESIRSELTSLQYGTGRLDSSGIELSRIAINDPSFEFLNDQLAFRQGLLDWIDLFCDVELSDQTIDALKQADLQIGKNPIAGFSISTLLLLNDNVNRLLITDDTFILRMGLLPQFNRIVSSEHYMKYLIGNDSPILNEFVRNRYIKYSPSKSQLSEEYSKFMIGSYSNYTLLMSNLSLFNSAENRYTAIAHLKEIALKPMLSTDQILRDMTNVIVNILTLCTEELIDLFGRKLYFDFALLGQKQDIAVKAFFNAKNIILSSTD
ncbi:MAG: hypothetical protein EOP48_09765 [Sphingobacteriales bacterium]|nr:MAG: hypothetical protein EOP48_09765 [Sphingobacteriales bacterium]